MCIFTAFGTAVRATLANQKKYGMEQVARYYKMTSTAKKDGQLNTTKANSAGKRHAQHNNPDPSNSNANDPDARQKKKLVANIDYQSSPSHPLNTNANVAHNRADETAKHALKNSDKTSEHSSNSAVEVK